MRRGDVFIYFSSLVYIYIYIYVYIYIYTYIYIGEYLQSKLPEANVPLWALGGWVTREDVLSVGVRSALCGIIRFG